MNAQADNGSPPAKAEVVEMIRQARGGEEAAFQWLRERFHWPLVCVVARKTGWEHGHAGEAVNRLWEEERGCILRAPEEGGYALSARGQFHYHVWNHCTAWSAQYDRKTFADGDGLAGPLQRHAVTPEDKLKPLLPIEDSEGRPHEIPVEQDFEADDGSGRSPDARARCEAMFVLLEVLFLPSIGYPHQQLSFGFSKLLYGRVNPGGIYGDPTRTVRDHGSALLKLLAEDLAKAYADLVALTPADHARVQGALTPLRVRLPVTVAEMIKGDRESELQCSVFADRQVGATQLQDYFGAWKGDGVKAITNWSNRVKERVQRWLRR